MNGGGDGSFLGDALDFLDAGAEAMGELFDEVKQTVKDYNAKEITVVFLPSDVKLGMRLEKRPSDGAAEVTLVHEGSSALRLGVRSDDVVCAVNGHPARTFEETMPLLKVGLSTAAHFIFDHVPSYDHRPAHPSIHALVHPLVR